MKVKEILLTFAAVLALTVAVSQAAELYSYYSFDNGAELAKDDSGNGLDLINDDTYVLPGYTSDGAVGGAAVLDGVEQGFQGAGTLYRPGSFTMSLWVKPAVSSVQQIIRSSNSGKGYLLKADSDYRIYIYSSGSYSTLRSLTAPAADQWAHILVRFDSDDVADVNGDYTGDAQIFIDGELKGSLEQIKYNPDGAGYLCLGKRASDLFNGQLDEFAVFSGALTDEEIGYLATKEATPLNVIGYVPEQVTELYAYYSFDDSSNLANDDSENGFNLTNNTTYNLPGYTAEGAVNGAAVLDGSTQGFLADETLFRPGSYTASIWVKPATTAGQLIIQSSNSGKGYLLKADTDYRAYIYYTGGNTNVRSSFAPVAGEWTHIAVRFISDGQADVNGDYTGDAQIFINGEPKNLYEAIKSYPDGAGYLCLGKRASASFNGQLDEFAVFSGALTNEEIGYLASKEATPVNVVGYVPDTTVSYKPVGYYSFDDPNGIVFGVDDSGNGRDLINDDTFLEPDFTNDGAVNGAAVLNGLGQAFRYNGGELCPYGALSTSIWVRSNEIGLSAIIAVTRGYSIQLVGGEYRFYLNNSGGYTTIRLFEYVTTDNEWVHLAMSYTPYGEPDVNGDYTGDVEAYFNGALVRTIPDVKYNLTGTSGDYLYLGRRASDKFLEGSIDEFAVWDVALADWQIGGLATGKYTPMTIPSGLVGETDLNGDGFVNIEDFAILASNWLKTSY